MEIDKYRGEIIKAAQSIKGKANEIDIGEIYMFPLLSLLYADLMFADPAVQSTLGKLADFRGWFEKRLDDAIAAAEKEKQQAKAIENKGGQNRGSGEGKGSSQYLYLRMHWLSF